MSRFWIPAAALAILLPCVVSAQEREVTRYLRNCEVEPGHNVGEVRCFGSGFGFRNQVRGTADK